MHMLRTRAFKILCAALDSHTCFANVCLDTIIETCARVAACYFGHCDHACCCQCKCTTLIMLTLSPPDLLLLVVLLATCVVRVAPAAVHVTWTGNCSARLAQLLTTPVKPARTTWSPHLAKKRNLMKAPDEPARTSQPSDSHAKLRR